MRWAAGLAGAGRADQSDAGADPQPQSRRRRALAPLLTRRRSNEITARGVLVVVSVGNEGGAVASPANCAGVLGVAGIRHAGTKVGFSNLGPGHRHRRARRQLRQPEPFTAITLPVPDHRGDEQRHDDTWRIDVHRSRRPPQFRHQLLGATRRRCCGADAFPQLAIVVGAVHHFVAAKLPRRFRRAAPRRRTSVTCRRAIFSQKNVSARRKPAAQGC